MTLVSTPACRRFIAAVWRSTCGETVLAASVGQLAVAVVVRVVRAWSRRSIQRVVSGGGEQRRGLLLVEVADDRAVVSLCRDGEHARDRGRVLGVTERGVVVETADRRQPGVAGSRAVAAAAL